MKATMYTLIAAALLFLVVACSANSQSQDTNAATGSDMPLKITTVHASSQCGPTVTTQWISSQQQFETLFRATQQQMITPALPQPPNIDFTRYGIVLVSMGQQRTGGYVIELAQEDLAVSNDTALITVRWREPEPGMMVTQVLTHPCVFLKVPRADYQLVRVVDQENKVRAELTMSQQAD
jgi:hypothetical protein